MADVDVPGKPPPLHLEALWIRDVTITVTTPTLLELMRAGKLDDKGLATHRFGFGEVPQSCGRPRRPGELGALTVAVLR